MSTPIPPKLSAVEVAFSVNPPLPAWSDIPAEFRAGNRWTKVADTLFFEGGSLSKFGLCVRDGVDRRDAMNALQACLGSYAPKHEHKIAGVGYLLSCWCVPLADAEPAR